MSINPKKTNKRGTINITLILLGVSLILFLVLSLISDSKIILTISFSLFLITLILSSFYLYLHFFDKNSKIRKQLNELQNILNTSSIDILKSKYLSSYELYLKLSEKEKRNFYAKINNFRETIEEHLKTQKKVELFLENAVKGALDDQKENFAQLMDHFKKLPQAEQEKYLSQLNSIKERLERESSI
jgi:hypothetical protein